MTNSEETAPRIRILNSDESGYYMGTIGAKPGLLTNKGTITRVGKKVVWTDRPKPGGIGNGFHRDGELHTLYDPALETDPTFRAGGALTQASADSWRKTLVSRDWTDLELSRYLSAPVSLVRMVLTRFPAKAAEKQA